MCLAHHLPYWGEPKVPWWLSAVQNFLCQVGRSWPKVCIIERRGIDIEDSKRAKFIWWWFDPFIYSEVCILEVRVIAMLLYRTKSDLGWGKRPCVQEVQQIISDFPWGAACLHHAASCNAASMHWMYSLSNCSFGHTSLRSSLALYKFTLTYAVQPSKPLLRTYQFSLCII